MNPLKLVSGLAKAASGQLSPDQFEEMMDNLGICVQRLPIPEHLADIPPRMLPFAEQTEAMLLHLNFRGTKAAMIAVFDTSENIPAAALDSAGGIPLELSQTAA